MNALNRYNLDSIDREKSIKINDNLDDTKILCTHCKRTIDNGIRCMGICVADNDY
tara:strand:+ start:414 stop:578 length:165 start_codon:yes stop_codon:yes gene_type:complete